MYFTFLSRITHSSDFAKIFIIETSHIYFFLWTPLLFYIFLKKSIIFQAAKFLEKGIPLLLSYFALIINVFLEFNFLGILYLLVFILFIVTELSDKFIEIILKKLKLERKTLIYNLDHVNNEKRNEVLNLKFIWRSPEFQNIKAKLKKGVFKDLIE